MTVGLEGIWAGVNVDEYWNIHFLHVVYVVLMAFSGQPREFLAHRRLDSQYVVSQSTLACGITLPRNKDSQIMV